MKRIYLLIMCLLGFNLYLARAQEKSDSTAYLSFDKAITILEKKHHVRFYYDIERFQNKTVHRSITEQPLSSAIDRLTKLTGYSLIRMNGNGYVFLPYDVPEQQLYQEYITVGNPLDFGKNTSAVIEGKVVDGKTGEPISGAVVSNDKLKIAVNTDKDGNFSMKSPVGEQEFNVKFYGYEENVAKLKIYGKGKVQLELFEKSINLDEVIVKAEMAQNGVLRNQMSLVKLDAKGIKELPVSMGETDIIKSVTLMPGVQNVGEFGTGFNVRGGSADQNLVLMEDLPVFNPSHVFGIISIVNPDDVSNVTLLKAGIPARYGERASSVLDIKMGGQQPDKITAKGGIGLINSRLSLKVPLFKKEVVWSVGGRNSYSDWLLKKMPDNDLLNSSAKFYDLNSMLIITPNASNRISVYGYYSYDKFRFSSSTLYTYNNQMGGIHWSHIFSNSFSMNMMAGRSIYGLGIDEDYGSATEWSKIKSGITYDCFRWNFALDLMNTHSIDFGVNTVRYINDPGELTPGDTTSTTRSKKVQKENALELSVYLSDNIKLSDKLDIEAGFRFTRYLLFGPYDARFYDPSQMRVPQNVTEVKSYRKNDVVYSYSGFEPRLSSIYRINGESSVKLSFTRIHQFLNLVSNTSVMAPTDVWKLSDNNIKPLTSDQIAVGYYRNYPKKFLEASVELYYKKLSNIIEYKDGADLLINQSIETALLNAQGRNYGIEFYIKKGAGRLTGWVSYTYSRSLRKTSGTFDKEKVNRNNEFASNFDKPHNFVVQSNYHISRRWRFSSTFTYTTGRPQTLPEMKYPFAGQVPVSFSYRNKYRLPDFHRLDVSITLDESLRLKKKWKGSWTLSIINLYGRKNAYSTFYQSDKPSASNNYNRFSLYKLYIIGRPFPTLTYNFTF